MLAIILKKNNFLTNLSLAIKSPKSKIIDLKMANNEIRVKNDVKKYFCYCLKNILAIADFDPHHE